MKFPALYRGYKEARIIETSYDNDTKIIEGLRIDIGFKGVEGLNPDNIDPFTIRMNRMYDCFIAYPSAIAVIIVNMEGICIMYPDKLLYTSVSDINIVERVQQMRYPIIRSCEEFIPVGFERTFVKSESAFITPSRIYYNSVKKEIYYHNKWIPYSKTPSEFRKKSLYKELITQDNYNGIILLSDGTRDLLE